MSPDTFLRLILRPALALLGERFMDRRAEGLLLAIALQESGLQHRRQIHGPARGFWQFEVIGVEDVLTRRTSRQLAQSLLTTLAYPLWASAPQVHDWIEHNDLLACGIARLALWNDPRPLPSEGAEEAAHSFYVACWKPGAARPGDPRAAEARQRWTTSYRRAMDVVRA